MPGTAWGALMIGAFLAGSALVLLMVGPQRYEPPVAVVGATAFIVSLASIVVLTAYSPGFDIALLATLLGLLTFAFGYLLSARVSTNAPRRQTRSPAPADAEDGGVAVFLCACAEPETYAPRAVAAVLDGLAGIGVDTPGPAARPVLFAAVKARYRACGGYSPARDAIRGLRTLVAERLEDDPRVHSTTTCWCTDPDALATAVESARADGVARHVVVPLNVTDGHMLHRLESRCRTRLGADCDPLAVTPLLWGDTTLTERLAERVSKAVGDDDPASVGVALVGMGHPGEWSGSREAREHETFFMQRLRAELVEAGFEPDLVRLAWLEWDHPDVTEAVRHLAAYGAKRLLVVPASMPADGTATLVELRGATRLAMLDDDVRLAQLPAWGEDPVVADVIARGIRRALDETLERG